MRTLARILSGVASIALLAAGGPALYCTQASAHAMPCCKTSGRCDFGMKAATCCTVEPASGSPEKTTGAGTRSAAPGPEKRSQSGSLETPAPAGGTMAVARAGRLWYPPPHDGSPALYLRNASILR